MPTPNMNLLLPTVSVTTGPLWASELNAAFGQVDSHNHTTGQGVQIPTSGLALNADLPFNGFNATLLRSARLVNNGSPLSLSGDLTCLYASGGNLFYNNAIGQAVQITLGAGLDASSVGGFGGDYGTSTATAFYTTATTTFTYWSNTNVSAFTDTGKITIHPTTSSVTGISLIAPAALSSSYNLTLPLALPASKKILTVDASGNIDDHYDVDNSTITVSSNIIGVPNAGITKPKIATYGVGTGSGQFSVSSSTGSFSTTSNTPVTVVSTIITTTGRPVFVALVPDGSAGQTFISSDNAGPNLTYKLSFKRGSTIIASYIGGTGVGGVGAATFLDYMPIAIDFGVTAGTYTYSLEVNDGSTNTIQISNLVLVVYELL